MRIAKLCAVGAGALCLMSGNGALAGQDLQLTVYPLGYYSDSLTAPGYVEARSAVFKTPGNVSVIPAKAFQQTRAQTMKDVLATVPGVLAQPRYGEEVRLSIRGSGLSRGFHLRGISLLQDGVPVNLADGSGDFQEIDPLVAQHIEVYRGGNALRYGAASLGGAVNIVTPTATTRPGTILRMEGGSFGTLRLHASAAKDFGGSNGFAAATHSLSDNFRQQSRQNNLRFSGNIGHKFSDRAETRFYMGWNDLEQDVPGAISRFDALHHPETVPAINITNRYARDIRSLRVSNKTAFRLDGGSIATAGVYANRKSLYHPIFQVIDQDSLDLGGFVRLEGERTVLGVNVSGNRNDAKRFVNNGGKRGALTADSDQKAKNLELYAEQRFPLGGDLSLVAGAQAFLSWRDYDDKVTPAASDHALYRAFNPKIGLLYSPHDGLQIFGNIARSAEPPTFGELVQAPVVGFVPLDEQKAITAEIGTRMQQEKFALEATLYRAWVRDELLQFTTGPGIPASTYNAGKTIHQGLELGLGVAVTRRVKANLSYTLNDFFFDGDTQYGDNDLAGAPPHQLRAALRYEDPSGWFAEPNIEWVPQAPKVDYANTLEADEYAVLNLSAGAEIGRGMKVFLDGRNLLDRRYIATFSTIGDARAANNNVFYPGDGRAAFAGISVRF